MGSEVCYVPCAGSAMVASAPEADELLLVPPTATASSAVTERKRYRQIISHANVHVRTLVVAVDVPAAVVEPVVVLFRQVLHKHCASLRLSLWTDLLFILQSNPGLLNSPAGRTSKECMQCTPQEQMMARPNASVRVRLPSLIGHSKTLVTSACQGLPFGGHPPLCGLLSLPSI